MLLRIKSDDCRAERNESESWTDGLGADDVVAEKRHQS